MILLPFVVSRMSSHQSGKVRKQENFTQRKELFVMTRHKRGYDLFRRLYSLCRQRERERQEFIFKAMWNHDMFKAWKLHVKVCLGKVSCHRKCVEQIGGRHWERQGDRESVVIWVGNNEESACPWKWRDGVTWRNLKAVEWLLIGYRGSKEGELKDNAQVSGVVAGAL